ADFYSSINYKKQFSKMAVIGKEKVGSSDAYVIEGTLADGNPEKLYFDASTGLLVRYDFEEESSQGKAAIQSYSDDYKVVDGVKIPHLIKRITPAFTATTKITEVKVNVEVDDAKFAKPSAP